MDPDLLIERTDPPEEEPCESMIDAMSADWKETEAVDAM